MDKNGPRLVEKKMPTIEPAEDISVPDYERPVFCLVGIPIEPKTFSEVTAALSKAIRLRDRTVWSTPNLNNLVTSQVDQQFRENLFHSDILSADGMPIVVLARLLGIPISQRVAGSSVFNHMAKDQTVQFSVFFFGGTELILQKAKENLEKMSASTTVCCGYYAPGFGSIESMSSSDIIDRINSANPDMLVLALGTQRGHEWIQNNLLNLKAGVISHLGSVINFVGGVVPRAPNWMQVSGLEWCWRIATEPYLAPRYWHDFVGLLRILKVNVVPAVLFRIKAALTGADRVAPSIATRRVSSSLEIELGGSWFFDDLQPLRDSLSLAAKCELGIDIDVSGLNLVTPDLLGLLLIAKGFQIKRGLLIRIHSFNRKTRKQFRAHGAEHLLVAPAGS